MREIASIALFVRLSASSRNFSRLSSLLSLFTTASMTSAPQICANYAPIILHARIVQRVYFVNTARYICKDLPRIIGFCRQIKWLRRGELTGAQRAANAILAAEFSHDREG